MSSTGLSKDFVARADSAAFFEAWVGAVLARGGLFTLHHPFTVAKNADEVDSHAHTWDLDVGNDEFLLTPAEVKSVSLKFTGVADYPYKSVLVCSQTSWLNKWPGADKTRREFLFVSRLTGAILWLPKGSAVSMGHETYDAKRGQLYKVVRTDSSNLRPLGDFVERVHGH